MDLTGLRGVFFDLGSTLVYRTVSEEEAIFRIGQELGLEFPDDRALRKGLAAGRHFYRRHYLRCRTLRDEESLLLGQVGAVLEATHPEAPPSIAERLLRELRDYRRWWGVYDDVLPCLQEARRAGLLLGVISNWVPSLPRFCRALRLDGCFDVLISSRQEGIEKPDPALFFLAAERLNLAPEECLHVGDSYAMDAQGALAVGMRAALIDRNEAFRQRDVPLLHRLTDLVQAFQAVGERSAMSCQRSAISDQ